MTDAAAPTNPRDLIVALMRAISGNPALGGIQPNSAFDQLGQTFAPMLRGVIQQPQSLIPNPVAQIRQGGADAAAAMSSPTPDVLRALAGIIGGGSSLGMARVPFESVVPSAPNWPVSGWNAKLNGLGTMYHETSPQSGVDIATAHGTKQGIYLSPHPDLALGQRGRGMVLEFGKPENMDVQEVRKPASEFIRQTTGLPAEVQILKAPSDPQHLVTSMTLKPGFGLDRVSASRLANMVRSGQFTVERLPDGSVKWTRIAK